MKGTIMKSTGSLYQVRLDDGRTVSCRIRGNLRLKDFEATNPLAVGDHVQVEPRDGASWVTAILPRKNYIIRKSIKLSRQVQVLAANIDQALVIATPVFPRTSLGFIDRFLATAEAYSIPAGILFNKTDLYDTATWNVVRELEALYTGIGYTVAFASALEPGGTDSLNPVLHDKVTLFAGHSGVGKSSLINRLVPGLELKTASISSQHLKGTHTTTFAEMHLLPGGGGLIDTPGIREFGIIDFQTSEVSHYFPEIFRAGKRCRYNNCMHLQEVHCAVKEALREGKIAPSRYDSYLSIVENEDIFR
jgi:ribosome biogenesis GTPase